MKTLTELQQQQFELKKKAHLKIRKPYTRKQEKVANSNEYYFDRKTFRIIKKGQITLDILS